MDLWREVVGWVGSALLVASILQPTILRLRWLNLGASALLMAYNVMLGSAPMVALNVALVLINCWYLFIPARAARVTTTIAPAPEVPSRGRTTTRNAEEMSDAAS